MGIKRTPLPAGVWDRVDQGIPKKRGCRPKNKWIGAVWEAVVSGEE